MSVFPNNLSTLYYNYSLSPMRYERKWHNMNDTNYNIQVQGWTNKVLYSSVASNEQYQHMPMHLVWKQIHIRKRQSSHWLLVSKEGLYRGVLIYIQLCFLLVKLDKDALGMFFRDRPIITSNCNHEFRSMSITILLQKIPWLIPLEELEKVSNALIQISIIQ